MEDEWCSQNMESTPRLRRISKPSMSFGEREMTKEEQLHQPQHQQPKSILKVKQTEAERGGDVIPLETDEDDDELYTSKKPWESPTAPDSVFFNAYPRKTKSSKTKSQTSGVSTSPSVDMHRRPIKSFIMTVLYWVIAKIRSILRFLLEWIARKKLAV